MRFLARNIEILTFRINLTPRKGPRRSDGKLPNEAKVEPKKPKFVLTALVGT